MPRVVLLTRPPSPSQIRTQSRPPPPRFLPRASRKARPVRPRSRADAEGRWRVMGAATGRSAAPPLRRLASQRLQSPAGPASSERPSGRARRLRGAVLSPVLGHNLLFLLRDTGGYWLPQPPRPPASEKGQSPGQSGSRWQVARGPDREGGTGWGRAGPRAR